MPNLTPQEQRRAKKALAIIQKGPAAIVEHLMEVEEKVENTEQRLETKFDKTVAEIKASVPDMNDLVNKIKGKDADPPTSEQLIELIKPLIPKVESGKTPTPDELLALIRPLIPTEVTTERLAEIIRPMIPVVNVRAIADEAVALAVDEISPLIPSVDEIEKDLPRLGAPIRDSLELLKEDERLDETAIKNLDKREAKLSDEIVSRAIGIVDQRTSFLINKVSNLKNQVDNLPTGGSGATAFTDLTDVPSSYAGAAQRFVKVNVAGDGLEFVAGSGAAVAWGDITGTLSDQTDLQAALDTKVSETIAIAYAVAL